MNEHTQTGMLTHMYYHVCDKVRKALFKLTRERRKTIGGKQWKVCEKKGWGGGDGRKSGQKIRSGEEEQREKINVDSARMSPKL